MSSNITVKERVKSFLSRRLIYEENGELKLYEVPASVSFEELIERFEKEKGVKFDPASGECRPASNDVVPEQKEEQA